MEKKHKDIRNLFRLKKNKIRLQLKVKEEENYHKAVVIFGVTITLNTKVTVIEIKHCKFKNILIKLDHI